MLTSIRLLVGMQNGSAPKENNMEFPQKNKDTSFVLLIYLFK